MLTVMVIAVLLLVCIMDTEGVRSFYRNSASHHRACDSYRDNPCGDGWSRIDEKRCAKFIGSPKTFQDAQDHCRTLNSELVSMSSPNEMMQVLCLTWRADSDHPPIWTGTTRLEGGLKHTNGSKFRFMAWSAHFDGQKDCIEFNTEGFGYLNVAHCSQEKSFVCAKEM